MSDAAHGVARDQLRAFVERIERLEEEKKRPWASTPRS